VAAPDGVGEAFLNGVTRGVDVGREGVREAEEIASTTSVDPLDLIEFRSHWSHLQQ
jgi:hypothetical protein